MNYFGYFNVQLSFNGGKVKLRFNRLTSQNCKSIKRDFLKIILELLKRSIVKQKMLHFLELYFALGIGFILMKNLIQKLKKL